ncbi:MAG: hypothetical protein L3J35_03540 [Bacteroidales bacterium]|nr:hypothetical protein [Bacteroidales bacterium]
MKKLSIFILLIFFFGAVNAQEAVVTWDGLKKQKEKSDSDITNAKKSTNPKTWIKRSDLYFNIHTFVIGGLYQGMPAKSKDFNNAELLVGKPGKIMTNGDNEIWVYNRKKLIFKNGLLDSWEQTEFIDKNALSKSGKALLKAVELDTKGTLKDKTSTKEKVMLVKNTIINDAITYYTAYSKNFAANNNKLTDEGKAKLDKAFELMSLGYELSKLPKKSNDTIFNINQVEYFKGVIAYNNQKYDIAKSIFESCISKKYGEGNPYHYSAECYAKAGDSSMYIKTVKKGFEAYPEEEQLIIDLINYYMLRNETKEAIEYINIAINKNPENASYYSAKAAIFDNRTDDLLKEYHKYMDKAIEYKKEAFRERNNPSKKAAAQKLRDAELDKATVVFKQIENDLQEAENLYKEALKIKPDFFNAAYNIGRIFVKRADRYHEYAEYILKVYITKNFSKNKELEDISKTYLKKAAEKYEVAHKINPNDRDALTVLKQIYFKLHDYENRERVEKLLDNLQTEESDIN